MPWPALPQQEPLPPDTIDDFETVTVRGVIRSEWWRFDQMVNVTETEVTIAAGEITPGSSFVSVDTEGGAATDDLVKINGGSTGDVLILRAADNARTVVVKDSGAGGNILLAGADFSLDARRDTLMLIRGDSSWLELSRSNNG